MSSDAHEQYVARELRDQGLIIDIHYRLWLQHRNGFSFRALRPMFGRSAACLWRWYQITQYAVEKACGPEDQDQDAPRCGVTIHRASAITGNDSPFIVDRALQRLGI